MTAAAQALAGTGTTIVTRVRERARSSPHGVAMRKKWLGVWQEVTWVQYWDSVCTVGHALLALGVEPGDRVAIHSENRPEWLYTDIAAVAIRGVTIGLYPTNPSAEVAYLLSHSGAKVLIAEDQEQVDKALDALDQCPDLAHVVYVEPRGIGRRYQHPKLLSWKDFLALGADHREANPGAVEHRMSEASPQEVMTLIYTSGTTGPPKGAMLSVANVEYAIATLVVGGAFTSPPPGPGDLVLSYLPLCHVAERIFTTWFNAAAGVQVNFAESIETIAQDLREVQPTILFGVPRIWEKALAGIKIGLASATPMKRLTAGLWLGVAARIGARLVRTDGRHTLMTRLLYSVGWVCFYRPLRERIGMRHVRYAASGAAPIAPEVLEFFMGIGVAMHEVYGMTENTAVATANLPRRIKLGTVGEPHAGTEVRVDAETGEILVRHPGVFLGYWRDEQATARVVEPDGWLHTGDVGEWVGGTHLRITDRMKDIIITAGGKNLAPSELENALKASPYVREAVVIGDRRPYVTALIGIELDTIGDWAQRRGLAYTTYRDLSGKSEVEALVQDVVDAVNQRFAAAEQIKQFRLLPKELDHEDGELTATQKVKRKAIARAFEDLIESMYSRRQK
jgi:long-chain acyl-CoA synthetase